MSENNQPLDWYEENAGSITAEPRIDEAATGAQANDNTDNLTNESDVSRAGTCRRVANAALVGASLGAVAGACAAALTGKGVADGVKTIVDGAAQTVKEASENVKTMIIAGAADTAKGIAYGVNSTVEEEEQTQVATPLDKEQVFERTSPVEASRSVSSGQVEFDAKNTTLNAANSSTSSDALVQMLLHQVGTELAKSFYEQLPAFVLGEIQRLATNPTLEEQQWIRDKWAKALEPLAMAIIESTQSYNTEVSLIRNNGYSQQVNHVETPIL
jgi:pimeloyl-ACP methyl ester carboxylesterase